MNSQLSCLKKALEDEIKNKSGNQKEYKEAEIETPTWDSVDETITVIHSISEQQSKVANEAYDKLKREGEQLAQLYREAEETIRRLENRVNQLEQEKTEWISKQ